MVHKITSAQHRDPSINALRSNQPFVADKIVEVAKKLTPQVIFNLGINEFELVFKNPKWVPKSILEMAQNKVIYQVPGLENPRMGQTELCFLTLLKVGLISESQITQVYSATSKSPLIDALSNDSLELYRKLDPLSPGDICISKCTASNTCRAEIYTGISRSFAYRIPFNDIVKNINNFIFNNPSRGNSDTFAFERFIHTPYENLAYEHLISTGTMTKRYRSDTIYQSSLNWSYSKLKRMDQLFNGPISLDAWETFRRLWPPDEVLTNPILWMDWDANDRYECVENVMISKDVLLFKKLHANGMTQGFPYRQSIKEAKDDPSKLKCFKIFSRYFKNLPAATVDKYENIFDHLSPPRNFQHIGNRIVSSAKRYLGRLHWIPTANSPITKIDGEEFANDFVLMFRNCGKLPETIQRSLQEKFQNAKGAKPNGADEPSMCCWEFVVLSLMNSGLLTPQKVHNIYLTSNESPSPLTSALCNDNLIKYRTSPGALPNIGDLCFYQQKDSTVPEHVAIYIGNERVIELIGDRSVQEGDLVYEYMGILYHVPVKDIVENVDNFIKKNPSKGVHLKNRGEMANELFHTKYRDLCLQRLYHERGN